MSCALLSIRDTHARTPTKERADIVESLQIRCQSLTTKMSHGATGQSFQQLSRAWVPSVLDVFASTFSCLPLDV